MPNLSKFEITNRWPANNENVIQLYSLPTPNGMKISAMLEESGLDYEAHFVDFGADDQHSPEFESLNPNGKIPAIIDPNGPGGEPIGLFESGAILQYLAEKSGKMLPSDPFQRWKTLQWLHFQMGGIGPMFGQFGHFYKFAGDNCDHPYPLKRYQDETQRLLDVMDNQLEETAFIAGDDYSIADIAIWPWVQCLGGFYDASEILELADYDAVNNWLEKCLARPASKKASAIPSSE